MSDLFLQFEIHDESSFQLAMMQVRSQILAMNFDQVRASKLLTASSEIARNIIKYADFGHLQVTECFEGIKSGVAVTAIDQGPGIIDIEQAMQDSFSSSGTLGQGLPGAKRLVDDFSIESTVGQGTRVRLIMWL